MESIENTMTSLIDSFNKRMVEFESQVEELKKPPSTIGSLTTEFTAFKGFIKQALDNLQKQVKLLSASQENVEVRSRRKMLMVHGMPEAKGEDTARMVLNIVRDKLKFDDFSAGSIKRCHRMGSPRSAGSPRPILFKLEDIATRDKVWFAKTKLKTSGITISEFLIKSRHQIFMAARSKFGISRCWTREGSVYILGNDNIRHHITSLGDLDILQAQEIPKPTVNSDKSSKPKRAAAMKK